MNTVIYKMEMRRNFKSFLIWSLSICAILFFGMLFYPAIGAKGLINQMEVLFENPMMKGMLAAFGADVYSMSSLMGFYVTYNSIYNVLLCCIFASVLAGKILAGEESEKTAEFLYTRPVSRKTIFLSKISLLFTYITLLALMYFLTSFIAIETVKKVSPDQTLPSERDINRIISKIESNPEVIYEAFNLTEESFATYSLSYASELLRGNKKEVEEMDLNWEDMNSLLSEAMNGPEDFFEEVIEYPGKYMSLFSIPSDQKEEFLENIRGEREEYRAMKTEFFQSPELFLTFFKADPSIALDQFRDTPGSIGQTLELLQLPASMEKRIFRKYKLTDLLTLSTYVYLLILSIGSLVLFLSLMVKRGKSILGASLGLIFLFYFLNSLSAMASTLSPLAAIAGFVSPFTWMDRDFSSPDFGLVWWRILLFISLSAVSLLGAMRIFKNKDILI